MMRHACLLLEEKICAGLPAGSGEPPPGGTWRGLEKRF